MALIDKEYTDHPFYGSRKMAKWLQAEGYQVNRKRVQRLMRQMGLAGICPKKNISKSTEEHKKYPYLLRGVEIEKCNQVWSSDITYIKVVGGFMYLTAVIDWHSRYVLSWRLSNSLEGSFCIEAVEEALEKGIPDIFNTDQGVQYTSEGFIALIEGRGIKVSMDGKGRALDNIFIERLWRTVKYEEIYLKEYKDVRELRTNLQKYFQFYNRERPHQSLNYETPESVYRSSSLQTQKQIVNA